MNIKYKNISVSVEELRCHVNPLDDNPWNCDSISNSDIKKERGKRAHENCCLANAKDLCSTIKNEMRNYHIRRIATICDTFIDDRIGNSHSPIYLIIDENDHNKSVKILEGFHRISAALVTKTAKLNVRVAYTTEKELRKFFPSHEVIR